MNKILDTYLLVNGSYVSNRGGKHRKDLTFLHHPIKDIVKGSKARRGRITVSELRCLLQEEFSDAKLTYRNVTRTLKKGVRVAPILAPNFRTDTAYSATECFLHTRALEMVLFRAHWKGS